MGLKTKNYTINNYTYPEVYAVFNGEIRRVGIDHEISFNIHASRELALSNKPLAVKKVRVKDWDRKTDIVALAYQVGKGKPIETINPETQETETVYDGVFGGWEDDIVTE